AEAGKHALVEKPIGLNASEAMAIFEAAEVNNTRTAEAFMYRYHPQTAKVVDLVRDGAIGTLQYAYIPFSFRAGYDPSARLFSNELGGGGILDVGCYCTSFARLIAGATIGKPVA